MFIRMYIRITCLFIEKRIRYRDIEIEIYIEK